MRGHSSNRPASGSLKAEARPDKTLSFGRLRSETRNSAKPPTVQRPALGGWPLRLGVSITSFRGRPLPEAEAGAVAGGPVAVGPGAGAVTGAAGAAAPDVEVVPDAAAEAACAGVPVGGAAVAAGPAVDAADCCPAAGSYVLGRRVQGVIAVQDVPAAGLCRARGCFRDAPGSRPDGHEVVAA